MTTGAARPLFHALALLLVVCHTGCGRDPAHLNPSTMLQITERSAKADIIDAAVELTDTQAEQIANLKEDRKALACASLLLLAATILF